MKLKSKINNRILNDFAWLDILTLKSKKKVNFKLINLQLSLLNNSNLSLNFFEMLKDFKQIVRLLQTLNCNQKNSLVIQISNNGILLNILKSNIENIKNDKDIFIISDLVKEKIHYNNSNRIFLLLEEPLEKRNSLLLQKLSKDSICILGKWNRYSEKSNFGSYKFFNDLKDYKKIAFFIALLKQVK